MPGMTERNIRSVNLNLLLAFDALMAERNVTRAARHNGLSQPAMSKALNRLRILLDDRLFELRDGRMEPTPRALEVAGPIRGALTDISGALKLPGAFDPGQAAGVARIAIIDLHQSNLLPALVARLRRDAPRLRLHFQSIERHRLNDQLTTGEIDLAIAPILAGAADLCAEPLWRDRLVTLVGKNNPLRLPMTLDSFAEAEHAVDAGHVRIDANGAGASLVDAILAARGLHRRIAVVLPSAAGLPSVVAKTDLIATLPSRIFNDLAAVPGLTVVPTPLPPVEVSPHILWHPRTQSVSLLAWIRAIIKETAAKLTPA
jgi:DNA-binding transcriptional LysR family regulator